MSIGDGDARGQTLAATELWRLMMLQGRCELWPIGTERQQGWNCGEDLAKLASRFEGTGADLGAEEEAAIEPWESAEGQSRGCVNPILVYAVYSHIRACVSCVCCQLNGFPLRCVAVAVALYR